MEQSAYDAREALEKAFKEYHSINNLGSRKKAAHYPEDIQNKQWLVLEKVHGANLSFIYDGTNLYAARRTAAMQDSETFFSWQEVREKYREGIKIIFEQVKVLHAGAQRITVYGELFGGIYPHEDVKDTGYQPVQKGVYYCPWIDFYAFDILVHDATQNEPYWMNYNHAMKCFEAAKMFYAKPLREGSLTECLSFDIKISSTIPVLFGLPRLSKNQIEGVIIKCTEPLTLPGKGRERAIFKHKNDKFAEVNPKPPLTVYEQKREEAKQAEERIYTEIERYINENRLDTVISKLGPVNSERINEFAEFMAKDAIKDFCKDEEELWGKVADEKRENFAKNVRSKVAVFIKEYLNKLRLK
jgi:Rnl2 family RNA ligase